jgi:hypothetical protein
MPSVWHRVGHHYLKLLAIVGERDPDGLLWAVPQVRFDRARASLAHGEANLIKQ